MKEDNMIKVTLSTPEGRQQHIVEPTKLVKDFLAEHEVNLEGANVSLDGITLSSTELRSETFANLGAVETARLSVVIKSDNGAK